MELTHALRWSGRGISNGRLRLPSRRCDVRLYSLSARNSTLPRPRRLGANAKVLSVPGQYRHLSLFGWGSSPKPNTDDFANIHSSSPISSPPSGLPEAESHTGATSQTPSNVFEATRTVKASHATSDVPDPTSNTIPIPEPEVLNNVTDTGLPAGTFSETGALPTEVAHEYIGYMRDIGLDYGWGIRSTLEYMLEHLHLTAGLSWATSIIVLAVITRSVVFPFLVRSSDMAAKFSKVKGPMAELQRRFNEAKENGDIAGQQKATVEIRGLLKDYKVSFRTMFIPVLVQMPLAICNFWLISSAAALPIPAFRTEAWYGMADLTSGSAYYILPLVTSSLLGMQAKLSSGAQAGVQTQGMILILTYVLPAANFIFMAFQPGAVQLYFLGSISCGFVQAFLLRQTWFRSLFGMTPMPAGADTKSQPVLPSSQNMLQRRPNSNNSRSEVPSPTSDPASPDYVAPPEKRSLVDQYVDGAKARMKAVSTTFLGDKEERVEKATREREETMLAKYEARARRDQQLTAQQRRNQQGGNSGTSTADDAGPGGLRLTSAAKQRREQRRQQ